MIVTIIDQGLYYVTQSQRNELLESTDQTINKPDNNTVVSLH